MDRHQDLQLRSIDDILDRFERRQSKRQAQFPPDFRHGDAVLREIYDEFGEAWVEGTVFVQYHCDDRGRPTAASIARFSDWFLTVEHHGVGEDADLEWWLRDHVDDCRTVVELRTSPGDGAGFDTNGWVELHCSPERLRRLEESVLHLVRDGAPDAETIAQTNLLSVITLCARLGMHRLH